MVRPDPSVPQAIWRGGAITLEGFTVRLSAPGILNFRAMLAMRREELLAQYSTSPQHESARCGRPRRSPLHLPSSFPDPRLFPLSARARAAAAATAANGL